MSVVTKLSVGRSQITEITLLQNFFGHISVKCHFYLILRLDDLCKVVSTESMLRC